MSKFKLTQTAAEVQNILNNSLQKPTGLAKTKLVGVGVNGQENIEIGDNLTLANGKLRGGVNGLESDAEGNLTASKNLGVDGKLTLKSLVSESNPDGDITKELGGGSGGGGGSQIHGYSVIAGNSCHYEVYTTEDYDWMQIGEPTDFSAIFMEDQYKALRAKGTYPAAGYSASDDMYVYLFVINENNEYNLKGYDFKMKSYIGTSLQSLSYLKKVVSVIKLF